VTIDPPQPPQSSAGSPAEELEEGCPYTPDTPRFSEFLSFLKPSSDPTNAAGEAGETTATEDASSSNTSSPTVVHGVKTSSVMGASSLHSMDASNASSLLEERGSSHPHHHPNRPTPSPPPPRQYDSYTDRYPPQMTNYTDVHNTKKTIGRRCYRLNLERPFDIHCEQSPLEYGDYMAPWTKEVYPATVGPVEYCPPRHLGGEQVVWQELMRWSAAAASGAAEEDERKVNSLDELQPEEVGREEYNSSSGREGERTRSATKLASGVLSPGGAVHLDDKKHRADDVNNEEKRSSADELDKTNAASPTGGWRELTKAELVAVRKLGDKDEYGELTFQTYDLSHVTLACNDLPNNEEGLDAATPLRTVFSMDSNSSEEERLNPKSPEDMANDTARLFRRSELSLKEAAEKEHLEKMEREEAERKAEIERQERARETGLLPEGSPLDNSGRHKKKKGTMRKLSSSGKKMVRAMSRKLSDMQGTSLDGADMSTSWRGSAHHRSRSGSVGGRSERNSGLTKRSSMQALQIDKARDLVDESDDESGDAFDQGGDSDTEAAKKPLNVSLYVVGEYDVLNDLVNDGAKRLRDNKDSTDLDLLLQNDPCPQPDRWVRSTGWGKCNPSSNYAKIPPEDFDWERYNDKLRLKTGPNKADGGNGGTVPQGEPASNAATKQSDETTTTKADGNVNSKINDSTAMQATVESKSKSGDNAAAASVVHKSPPPPPSTLSPIPGSPAVPRVKTSPTDASTPLGGSAAASASSSSKTPDFLSSSVRSPRTSRGATKKFNHDPLSSSERIPSRNGSFAASSHFNDLSSSDRTNSRTGSKSKGFGFKRMLRGKSSGKE